MTGDPTSTAYLRRLERALKSLPAKERRRIMEEIRSHFAARGPAAAEGLGAPDSLAQSFIDDHDAARLATVSPAQQRLRVGRGIAVSVLVGAVCLGLYIVALLAAGLGYAGLNRPGPASGHLLRLANGRISLCAYFNSPCKAPGAVAQDLTPMLSPLAFGAALLIAVAATWLLVATCRVFLARPILESYRLKRLEKLNAS